MKTKTSVKTGDQKRVYEITPGGIRTYTIIEAILILLNPTVIIYVYRPSSLNKMGNMTQEEWDELDDE